jgi:hypothetical protein
MEKILILTCPHLEVIHILLMVAVKAQDVELVVQRKQLALEEVVALAVELEELLETPRVIQGRALRELQHKQVFPHLQVMVTMEVLI